MEKEIIKQTEQNETPDNRRTVFIGAKVSPRQKEHIKSLAEQCGMTVSDYLLARAYNYKPKARLSKEEAALLQNLDNCRADLVKYTSALHGMSASQRHMMFNQIPFMVNWLKELVLSLIHIWDGYITRNSASGYWSTFRGFLKILYRNRLIKANINDFLEKIEPEDVVKDYLSVEELYCLAETPCKIPVLKTASLFSCLTSLRLSDILTPVSYTHLFSS